MLCSRSPPSPLAVFALAWNRLLNGNLCTTASPQWPHFCPNGQPKNSFLFKPLSLKNDNLFTSATTPAPPHGRLGERSSGWIPCKTQHSLIWIASQPLKQALHDGDLKRQCQADIAGLGQFCAEITTKCLYPHTKCSCRAVIWRRCQTKKKFIKEYYNILGWLVGIALISFAWIRPERLRKNKNTQYFYFLFFPSTLYHLNFLSIGIFSFRQFFNTVNRTDLQS